MRLKIFTEYNDGVRCDTVLAKKGAGYVERVYIGGELFDERKIYKVDTEAPYVRAYCTKFYFTGVHLEALRELIKEA